MRMLLTNSGACQTCIRSPYSDNRMLSTSDGTDSKMERGPVHPGESDNEMMLRVRFKPYQA